MKGGLKGEYIDVYSYANTYVQVLSNRHEGMKSEMRQTYICNDFQTA